MSKRQDSISGYLYPLDGLRAISVILIFTFHTWQQSWIFYRLKIGSFTVFNFEMFQRYGYLAIDFFFVLSGFGLFYPIARSMFGESRFKGWKDFFIKRLRRIYPAYIIILAILIFVPSAVYLPFDKTSTAEWMKRILTNVLFVSNMNTHDPNTLISTAWTMAIEVQFYVLFPLICIPFRKKPVLTTILLAVIAVAARLWMISNTDMTQVQQGYTIGYLDVFGIGMLCAYFVVWARNKLDNIEKLKFFMTVISVLCVVAVIGFFKWIGKLDFPQGADGPAYFRFLYRGVMDVIVGLFIFTACFSHDIWQKKILGNRFFVFMSSISYAFYLIHQNVYIFLKHNNIPHSDMKPVMNDKAAMWGMVLICLGFTLVFSVLITKFVEQPIAKYGYKGYFKKIFSFLQEDKKEKKPIVHKKKKR